MPELAEQQVRLAQELQVRLVLLELVVLRAQQELLELVVLPELRAQELLELQVRLVLLELAEPLVPRVRAYLVRLVPQVQEYLAQRVQQELVLREPLVLLGLALRAQLAPLELRDLKVQQVP